ncbi:nucleobase:cation symporter-2 family protein [Alicyclobacillus kakegawensis]|uniref:nucleobase:cation symporter-2 family protein n=1 Tax=Alicyclobacillus kakegawensis TaxID=392012 RepID=UPI00082BCE7A|nr:nucleobase:cation symporter-2 family protein [Alicyclobacillus kakegawensis]
MTVTAQTLRRAQVATLGLQHVLAMYAGTVVVPLLIGSALKLNSAQMAYLLASDLFTCGIATLLQVIGTRFVGIRLPVVLGCTFTAVAPIAAIGRTSGMPAVFGAILAAGLMVVLVAPVFGKVLRLFPTVVTGSVVTIIGLSLIPVAMNDAAGGSGSSDFGRPLNLCLALGTLLLILFLNRFLTGFARSVSVLIGLIAGTLAGWLLGIVHFDAVASASWVSVVHPFYFGVPRFQPMAVLTMCVVCLVSLVESTGVYFAISRVTGQSITEADIVRGLRAEGLAILIGGVFNTFPYTTFSQNVGLVSLTRVKARSVIVAAGVILVILGCLPKLAALATVIPSAVLGGSMIAMFGMVVAYGMNILSHVDFGRNENLLVVACSVAVGLGSAVAPQVFSHLPGSLQMLLQNGIVSGSVTAVLLNLFLNHRGGAGQMSPHGSREPRPEPRVPQTLAE